MEQLLIEKCESLEGNSAHNLYKKFKEFSLAFESLNNQFVTGLSIHVSYYPMIRRMKSDSFTLQLMISNSNNGYDFMEYVELSSSIDCRNNAKCPEYDESFWTIEHPNLQSAFDEFENSDIFKKLSNMLIVNFDISSSEV